MTLIPRASIVTSDGFDPCNCFLDKDILTNVIIKTLKGKDDCRKKIRKAYTIWLLIIPLNFLSFVIPQILEFEVESALL